MEKSKKSSGCHGRILGIGLILVCRVKSIALTIALCVAGVMVAHGRDFGLVSIPDALNPQPRPEDVYECTAMIPLPKGGNIQFYLEGSYEEGKADEADDFYGFSVPDLTERNILSLLASAADQDRLIQLPISGNTWFGCTYERRGDGDIVIYEGAVVVEGAYFVVWFGLPPTQPLDREVMDILAQIRLWPVPAMRQSCRTKSHLSPKRIIWYNCSI